MEKQSVNTRITIITITIHACYHGVHNHHDHHDHHAHHDAHAHHDSHAYHDHQTQLLAQLRTAPVQDEAAVKKKIMET